MDDTTAAANAEAAVGDGREEIVVVRLEGLGTFAVPVASLAAYRVAEQPEADQDGPGQPSAAAEAVPVILEQDFLRGVTDERRLLTVDRFGGVHHPGERPMFGAAPG